MFTAIKGGKQLTINADFSAEYDGQKIERLKIAPANAELKKMNADFAGAALNPANGNKGFVLLTSEYAILKPKYEAFVTDYAKKIAAKQKRDAAERRRREDDPFGVGDADACEAGLKSNRRDFGNSIDETESY